MKCAVSSLSIVLLKKMFLNKKKKKNLTDELGTTEERLLNQFGSVRGGRSHYLILERFYSDIF